MADSGPLEDEVRTRVMYRFRGEPTMLSFLRRENRYRA